MRRARTVTFLLPIALLPLLHGQPSAYLKIDIDPGSRLVRLSEEVSLLRGFPKGPHFLVSPAWNIQRVVPIGPEQTASYPEYFHISTDSVLLDKSMRQEIFTGGF